MVNVVAGCVVSIKIWIKDIADAKVMVEIGAGIADMVEVVVEYQVMN